MSKKSTISCCADFSFKSGSPKPGSWITSTLVAVLLFTSLISNAQAPTTQASNITIEPVPGVNQLQSLKFNWTSGNGAGRIVIIKNATGAFTPVNATDIATLGFNSNFGTATNIATNAGNGGVVKGVYVVTGAGATITVTNLPANTPYFIQVYEWNGTSTNPTYSVVTNATNPRGFTFFTADGTFDVPVDVTSVTVQALGGGGGGGGADGNTGESRAGGGGAGGSYTLNAATAVTGGAAIPVAVGGGGAGGNGGNAFTDGGTGEASSFLGVSAIGGAGGVAGGADNETGAGATVTTGVTFNGGRGYEAPPGGGAEVNATSSGAGGGSAGTTGAGLPLLAGNGATGGAGGPDGGGRGADGVTSASASISLDGVTATEFGGGGSGGMDKFNDTDPADGGDGAPGYVIVSYTDVTAPTVTSIVRQNPTDATTNDATVTFRVTFNENVANVSSGDFVLGGTATGAVGTVTANSGAQYDVQITGVSGNGTLDLNFAGGQNITDISGNAFGGTSAGDETYTIDTTAPIVNDVTSTVTDGTFTINDVIDIQVVFSEDVVVTGTPQITLETGTVDRVINYSSGDGTNTLVFNYTVQPGDASADLDYVANSLVLNGGAIADEAGNPATLALAAPGATNSLADNKDIVIDGIQPEVTDVTSAKPDGTYSTGEVIDITVEFSSAVDVTGTPQLTLETGTSDEPVDYFSGTGTNTLTFRYTVQSGNITGDLDYTSTGALSLNGGTIKSTGGNDAILTLASPGGVSSLAANKDLVIDAVAPLVTQVSASTANGSYRTGTIDVTVTFDEPVTVTGFPQILLETGTTDRNAVYTGGSTTTTLTFTYTIVAGDASLDLDYTSTAALTLNGGTIQDALGTDADLTLPTPGAANSLASNKNIIIDTTPPAAPGTPDLADADDTGFLDDDNLINITTGITITGTAEANASIELFEGVTSKGTTTANGSGIWSIDITLTAGTHNTFTAVATDAAGNVGPASGALASIVVDTTPPTTGSLTLTTNGSSAETISWTFSESVTSITNGTGVTLANFTMTGFSVAGGYDAIDNSPAPTYTQASQTGLLTSSTNNSDWDGAITVSYASGSGNIYDAAGNAMATFNNVSVSDLTAPTLITGLKFNPNGSGNDIITFNVSETLNISEGPIAGFSTSQGAILSAQYSSKGVNNTITLEANGNIWNDNVEVIYNPATPGTAVDAGGNHLVMPSAFPGEPVLLKSIHIVSNNVTNTGFAITNDEVFVTFTSSRTLTSLPVVEIAGIPAVVTPASGPFTGPFSAVATMTSGVPQGVITIEITANETGKETVTTFITDGSSVIFDTVDPVPSAAPDLAAGSDGGYSPTDNITKVNNSLQFTVTAEAGATVRLYAIGFDANTDTNDDLLGTGVEGTPGNYTITTNGAIMFADGAYNFYARVTDQAGNTSTASPVLKVVIDNAPPVPLISTIEIATTATDPGNSTTLPVNAWSTTNGLDTNPSGQTLTYKVTFAERLDQNGIFNALNPSGACGGCITSFFTVSKDPAVSYSGMSYINDPTYPDSIIYVSLTGVTGTGTVTINYDSYATWMPDLAGNAVPNSTSSDYITPFTNNYYYTLVLPKPTSEAFTASASAITGNSITLQWNSTNTAQIPTHFLVLAKPTSDPTFPALDACTCIVEEGTYINDGAFAQNVPRVVGTNTVTFTGLSSGTNYNFIVYKYTNTADNINPETTAPAVLNNVLTTTASLSSIILNSTPVTIGSIKNDNGNSVDVMQFTIYDDGQDPISPNVMTLHLNGVSRETITFTLREGLTLADGANVTGFTSSTGTVASAIYSSATNTITLTNAANGTWNSSSTISYSATTGNAQFLTLGKMQQIAAHAVVQATDVVQILNTNGTFIVPAGVTNIQVEAWGAGGSGGEYSSGYGIGSSSGGGGGAYSRSLLTVTPGGSYNYTIGAGGASLPPLACCNLGNDGTATIFGSSLVVAAGGKGGLSSAWHTAYGPVNNYGPSKITGGQAASGIGEVKFSGGDGGFGQGTLGTSAGGSGGSSAGTGSNGNTGNTGSYCTGCTLAGAGAPVGGGAGGFSSENINAGTGGFGGGGGGVGGLFNSGAGGNGRIRITYSNPIASGTSDWEADNAPFKFSQLVITQGTGNSTELSNWQDIIATGGAELFDGTNTVVGTVNPTNITFTLPSSTSTDPGFIDDANGGTSSKTYTLRIWLRDDLNSTLAGTIDGMNLAFNVDVTNPATLPYDDVSNGNQRSSRLVSTHPAVQSGANPIEVEASQLVYRTPGPLPATNTNPQSQIGVGIPFSANVAGQDPEVYALDANNNLDEDYNNSADISNPLQNFGQSTSSISFVNGKLSLNPFFFTTGSTSVDNTQILVEGTGSPVVTDATSTNVASIISSLTTIDDGPGTEPATISSLNTSLSGASSPQQNAVASFDFTITDDFGANSTSFANNDALPTLFDEITITQGAGTDAILQGEWDKVIEGAELTLTSTTGSQTGLPLAVTTQANVTIGTNFIRFESIAFGAGAPGRVDDGSQNVYTLKIFFKNPVDPSLQDLIDTEGFEFIIANTSINPAPGASSVIATSDASSGPTNNRIAVDATQLDFITQWDALANQSYDAPLDADAITVGVQSPQVKARDANGNLDREYNTAATVTAFDPNALDSKTYPLDNDVVTVTNGLISFESDLQVSSSGNGEHGDGSYLILNSGSLTRNSNTFTLNYSDDSDILRETTFSYPENILYADPDNQVSDITPTTGVAMERFKIRDGGGSTDDDGTSTKLSSLTIRVTNFQYLRRLALYEVGESPGFAANNELIELDVTAAINVVGNTADFVFSGITGFEAPDNGSRENNFVVKVSFANAGIDDNEVITFEVIAVQAQGVGSAFSNPAPTGTASSVTVNENKIEVVATQIDFTTVPVNASINVSFEVIAEARDAFANRDEDYNGAISFTGNGNTSGYTVANQPTGSFTAGVLNYPVDNILTAGIDEGFNFTSGTTFTQLTINGAAENSAGESVDAGAITGISPLPGIEVSTSFDSWLYFDPLFPYTTRIPFVDLQETSLTSSSLALARLILSDGGAPGSTITVGNPTPGTKNLPLGQHNDDDGAFTEIESLTISITNFADIRKIGLFDNNGNLIPGTEQNAAATVTFANLDNITELIAPDNDAIQFYIRASFNETVGADLDQITLQVTDVDWASGSRFPPTDGTTTVGGVDGANSGGDSSDPTRNLIDVVATSLDFVTQPSAFAGINQPIDGTTMGNTGIVHARDEFENLDREFNFSVNVLAPATPVNFPASFASGVLNLSTMQYQTAGDGTLTVLSNGLDSSAPGNSFTCAQVDVIHVTAVEDQNNGVILSESLKGGTTNQRIFGFTFNPEHTTASEPSLTGFSIIFRNKNTIPPAPYPYTTGSSTLFKNFKIYRVVGGTLTLLTDPDDIDIVETQSAALAASGAPSTFKDKLDINFVSNVPIYDGNSYSYYLSVDVDVSANVGTPAITPYLVDNGYGSNTNDHIRVTQGSSAALVEGITRNFASTKPPLLVKTEPLNGKLNVDPALDTIRLYFDVPVATFDGIINLYNRETGALVSELQAVNGFYQDGTPLGDQTADSLVFVLPTGVDLEEDVVYYVTVEKGKFSNIDPTDRAGISDAGFNLFGGISYSGTFYFKTASPNPPVLLESNPDKYFYTPSTATFNLEFDQAGTVHYMVVDPAGAPLTVTNNQIRGIEPYTAGLIIAQDSVTITQLSPNLQFATINAMLDPAKEYPVYIYAKNDAEPVPVPTSAPYGGKIVDSNQTNDFVVGNDGPTITLKKNNVGRYSFPRYEICSGSVVRLQEPLIISELLPGEFQAGVPLGSVQSFNVLLPTGFQFDVTKAPDIKFNGADFDPLPPPNVAFNFINTTLLQIKFVNQGNSSNDNIIITDLYVRASTSDLTGFIQRFSGNGLAVVNDLENLARITSTFADPIPFTNTYDIANNFSAKYPGEIDPDVPVTYIPDNYSNTIRLIPLAPPGDYGASFFSGSGLTGDVLTLSAVQLDAAFNITLTHTNQNGCVSESAEQYAVYDHTNAIPELLPIDGDIRVCLTDPNFPGDPSLMGSLSDSVSYVGLAGYQLIDLYADIPQKADGTGQIIAYGSDWQNLVKNIPILYEEHPNANLGKVFKTYNWEYSGLMHSDSLSKYGLINPYESHFSKPTPSGQTYYTGGSLGLIEFTGVYQSTADFSVFIPFRQEVELFVPAIPLIEIAGKPAIDTLIFCENGIDILLNGYPAASAGASTGVFVLRDYASNTIIYDASASITPNGFIDNGNGTAALQPGSIFNNYNTIQIDYTYQDNNSPCPKTATAFIRITPNPVADFTAESVIGLNTPAVTAYCENNAIVFDASGSSFSGVQSDEYKWNFNDGANTSSTNPNIVESDTAQIILHRFATSARYNVSLTVTSVYGCESTAAIQNIDVGAIPVVNFGFTGISTADQIEFNIAGTELNSAQTVNDDFAELIWDFDHGTPQTITDNFQIPVTHNYPDPDSYNVSLRVTSIIGCTDSLTQPIIILAREIPQTDGAYFEDFEGSNSDWQPSSLPTTSAATNPYSWAHGTPTTSVIQPDPSINGASVWKTSLGGTYNPREESALYSPSFDLSNLARPMVSFNIFNQIETSDGVVLEYSVDGKNVADPTKRWDALGRRDEGVFWFNASGITAKPGDQPSIDYGWTGSDTTEWREAKHALVDEPNKPPIVGATNVVFRFALASAKQDPSLLDGFAIDNFRIGNRTRIVLVENFRNLGNGTMETRSNGNVIIEKDETDFFNNNFSPVGNDTSVIRINYHVGFPNLDPLNKDNEQDPGARALYYNISQTPRARMDGEQPDGATYFSTWGLNFYNTRSLKLADAEIDPEVISDVDGNGSIGIRVSVTALKDLGPKTILHVAIVEKSIGLSALSQNMQSLVNTGENNFEYVLKKLVPNAAGTRFNQTLANTQTRVFPSATETFIWSDNVSFYSPDNLSLIVFLQDEETREIYQTEIRNLSDPSVITGIEDINHAFKVYPNPADRQMTIELPELAIQRTPLQLFDQMGKVVHQSTFEKGDTRKTINTDELAGGVYLIQIESQNGILRRKVMVLHRN